VLHTRMTKLLGGLMAFVGVIVVLAAVNIVGGGG